MNVEGVLGPRHRDGLIRAVCLQLYNDSSGVNVMSWVFISVTAESYLIQAMSSVTVDLQRSVDKWSQVGIYTCYLVEKYTIQAQCHSSFMFCLPTFYNILPVAAQKGKSKDLQWIYPLGIMNVCSKCIVFQYLRCWSSLLASFIFFLILSFRGLRTMFSAQVFVARSR